MFKFKMHTKVLVAVIVYGLLIESNLSLSIALSIDLNSQVGSVRLFKTWQADTNMPPNFEFTDQDADQDGGGSSPASPHQASTNLSVTRPLDSSGTTTTTTTNTIRQILESDGRWNYFGMVLVGEKEQPFMVFFELTSTLFWLPSSECKVELCLSRQRYNRSQSAPSKPADERQLNYTYEGYTQEPASVTMRLARDRLTFAGVTIEGQTFGEATEISGEPFRTLPVDGFMGLGFRALPDETSATRSDRIETPFERLHAMGLLREPIFSLLIKGEVERYRYSTNNGELVLGQLAEGYTASELTYVPVTHADQWEFRLTSVSLRHPYDEADFERACESACPATLDTRSHFISGHRTDVDRLNKALGAIEVGAGLYRLPHCDLRLMADLIFSIGGAEFSLPPEAYVIMMETRGSPLSCYSALRVVQASQYPYWILGERFLKRHYVVFDYGQKRIGFAKSKSMSSMYGLLRRKPRII